MYHLQVLTMLEEFRQIALPRLGMEWANTLPRVPLTKAELKQVVKRQWERDETAALRQLADLGSVSAGIITRLELTREIIQMATSILRTERAAQVTLMSILGGTRFKAYFHGVLVPTKCPHKKRRGICGEEDSYEHLLWCYWLENREQKGPDSLDFLVAMARKTIPQIPGTAQPMFVQREFRSRQDRETQQQEQHTPHQEERQGTEENE